MFTPETTSPPVLGQPGELCAGCGVPLASDQRYCLNCGYRRADSRVPYAEVLAGAASRRGGGDGDEPPAATGTPPSSPAGPAPGAWTPTVALIGVGVVALVLGVGVLIGRSVSGSTKRAAAPQVISVGGAGAGPATASASNGPKFKGDWPAGKDGYTVELRALSKAGTQPAAVAAAKSDAGSKGAAKVGALDSDSYASLAGGQYVIYSGVYKTQADAAKALTGLKKKFPQAKVIHVAQSGGGSASASGSAQTLSRQQLNSLSNTSGSDYFKKSSKLPKKIAIPGPPPATDKKAPGGGSGGGQTIG
jgi:hypothetical protein